MYKLLKTISQSARFKTPQIIFFHLFCLCEGVSRHMPRARSESASKRQLRTSNSRVNLFERGIAIVACRCTGRLGVPYVARSNLPQKDAYGAPFVKILYLTDLAQKVLSLRIYSYLCTDVIISAQRCYLWQRELSLHAEMLSLAMIAISACRDVISGRDSYLCMQRCYLWQR